MQNIMCRLAYDGTRFFGFQEQPHRRTVNGVMQQAARDLLKEPIRIIAAGRTDAGVHAEDQVINFLTRSRMPAKAIAIQIQQRLPEDILIRSSLSVSPTFHARFMPHRTTYRYIVENHRDRLPTDRFRMGHFTYPLNQERMRQALHMMEGRHSFRHFTVEPLVGNPVRVLERAELDEWGTKLVFRFSASGFLRRQVRLMVGTVLDIGRGKIALEELDQWLSDKESPESQKAGTDSVHTAFFSGFAAEPCGLTLERIVYAEDPTKVGRLFESGRLEQE